MKRESPDAPVGDRHSPGRASARGSGDLRIAIPERLKREAFPKSGELEECLSKTKGRQPAADALRLFGPAPGGAGLSLSGAYFAAAVSAASPVNPHRTPMREGRAHSASMA